MGVDSHLHNSPGAAISKRALVAGVLFAIGLASLVLPFLALAGLAPSAFLARSHQLVVAHGAFAVTLAFAYGGGSFAFWLGRADNAWHQRRDLVGASSEHPPSHYRGRLYVDSVVFEPAALRLLIEVIGSDRVMMGSDYPYPLGERPAGRVIREAGLDPVTEAALLGGNAQAFLGPRGNPP